MDQNKQAANGLQVNMSVAIIPMAEELGWKAADRGIASAAFFWGYTLTQIPAGIFSTRYSGHAAIYKQLMCQLCSASICQGGSATVPVRIFAHSKGLPCFRLHLCLLVELTLLELHCSC